MGLSEAEKIFRERNSKKGFLTWDLEIGFGECIFQFTIGIYFASLITKKVILQQKPITKVHLSVLLFSYLSYLMVGAIIFHVLEEDFEVDKRQMAVKLKSEFLTNRANKTEQEVEIFVQMMASFVLLGIPPTGNKTDAVSWTFFNSFITSTIIISTIGYGTVFPNTLYGQLFCIVFAAIGIPLTILVFNYISSLVFLPFEKLGDYLEYKGVNERNVTVWKIVLFIITGTLFFLVLPPFVFMSLENWTYVQGIYYSFTTISAIGLGDYATGAIPLSLASIISDVSNPFKDDLNITYSILLLIWNTHGLVWIALLFNLIMKFLYVMELKLTEDSSEELGGEEEETDPENRFIQ